jgi:hypothetical protein
LATEQVGDGGSLVAIGRLRAVVARLAELEDGGGAAFQWFAERLAVCDIAGGRTTADVAFGLAPTPGHEGWWTSEKRTRRDALLCEIATRFYANEPSERCRADNIASRIARFASGARLWRPGTIEELLVYIMRTGPAPPARTIQRALAAGRRCQMLPAVAGTDSGVAQSDDQYATQTADADC